MKWNRFKSSVKAITTPTKQTFVIQDGFLSIPRIIGGLLLSFSFGADKFGMPWSPEGAELSLFEVKEWFIDDVSKFGGLFEMFPKFFAWMGAGSEAIGGFFLALGFQTRLFGFLTVCTMLVAIFFQKWNQGFWGVLPAMGFLWIGIYAMVLGSGRFGVDHILSKRFKK